MFFVFEFLSLFFFPLSLSPVSLSLSPSPLDVYCKNSSFVCNIASFFLFYPYRGGVGEMAMILVLLVLESLSTPLPLSLSFPSPRKESERKTQRKQKKMANFSRYLAQRPREVGGRKGSKGRTRPSPKAPQVKRRFCLFW